MNCQGSQKSPILIFSQICWQITLYLQIKVKINYDIISVLQLEHSKFLCTSCNVKHIVLFAEDYARTAVVRTSQFGGNVDFGDQCHCNKFFLVSGEET